MEVILRETIDNLGRAGQVVKVANGYARNYLLPKKLAYVATAGNMKVIEAERQTLLRKEARQKDDAEKLQQTLDAVEITIRRKVGEQNALYGSVTNSDVADELEKKGFQIEKRKIHMEDHIKSTGEFSIPIRLFKDVTAHIKLKVEAEPEA
jgi:large subunit ribosomal protein L9